MGKRVAHVLAFALTLLVTLLAALYATLTSSRFESQIADRLSQEARSNGVELTIGQMEIRPLRLGVRVRDAIIRTENGIVGHAASIRVGFGLASLLSAQPRFRSLTIERADLELDVDLLFGEQLPRSSGSALLNGVLISVHESRIKLRVAGVDALLQELELTAAFGPDARPIRVAFGAAVERARLADQRELGPGRLDLEAEFSPNFVLLSRCDVDLRPGITHATGTIDRGSGAIELSLHAQIQLAAAAALLGAPAAVEGKLQFDGNMRGDRDHPRFTGQVNLDRLSVVGREILTKLRGDVVGGRERARLLPAEAIFMTGDPIRIQGSAFDHEDFFARFEFNAPAIDVAKIPEQVPGFPFIAGQTAAVGTVTLPKQGPLRIAAQTRFAGLQNSLAGAAVDPRIRHLYGPVDGNSDLAWEGQEISIERAELQSEWGRSVVEGDYRLDGTLTLCGRVMATRLAALSHQNGPNLHWLGRAPNYWLNGLAFADVLVQGHIGALELTAAGHALGISVVTDAVPDSQVAAPLGDGDFELRLRDGVIRWTAGTAAATVMTASGETEIGDDRPGDQRIALSATGIDTIDLAHLLGWREPIGLQGVVHLEADLVFTNGLSTNGVRLTGAGSLRSQPIEHFSLSMVSDDGGLTIDSLDVGSAGATLAASGRVAEAPGATDFTLSLAGVDLRHFLPAPEVKLGGLLSAHADLTGTIEQWKLSAGFTVVGTDLAGISLGEVSGSVVGDPDLLRIDLLSDVDRDLWADLRPSAPYPFRATASFEELELGPVLRLIAPGVDLALVGNASGALVATGALAPQPRLEKVTLELTEAAVAIKDYQLKIDPLRMVLRSDGTLDLGNIKLHHAGDQLTVAGRVDLEGSRTDVTIVGQAELQLLQIWYPDLVAVGPLTIDVRLEGRNQQLMATGELRLTQGYLRGSALPYPLRDMNAEAHFSGRRLEVTALDARFGGGFIQADASLELDRSGGPALEARVRGRDVRFTLFQDLEIRADPDLTYQLTGSHRKLSGTLTVDRATYVMRPGATSGKLPESELGLQGFADTELDLRISAAGNLWLLSEEARLEGDAELRVRGTASDPVVLGSIRYLAQEKLVLDSRNYQVNRGTLSFDNPTSLDPILDFEAETSLQGYDVVIGISGPLSAPRINVSSNPPLAESSVLALLGGGTATADVGVTALSGGQEILYQLLLPRTLSGFIPRVSISPYALRGKRDPTEVFPLTIRLPKNFDITVGIPRQEAAAELLILDWKPIDHYTFSAVRDLDRSWGVEALAERRFGKSKATATGRPRRVRAVTIAGLDTSLIATALARLNTRTGTELSDTQIRRDVDRLHSWLRDQDYPLARVDTTIRQTDDKDTASSDVTFEVDAGRRVEVVLAAPHQPGDLEVQLSDGIQSFGLYSETEHELERIARASYEHGGYPRSLVSCDRTDPPGQSGVQFRCEVEPGPRVSLAKVRFDGVRSLSESTLRAALITRPALLRPARMITADIETDLSAVRAHHRAAGHLNATTRGEIRDRDPRSLELVIHVDEGEPFTVSKVIITGASPEVEAMVAADLRTHAKQPFLPATVAGDREHILTTYGELGHLDTRVTTVIEKSIADATVAVTFQIEAASVIRVDSISYVGLRRTRPEIVTRAVGLAPGDLLSYSRIAHAQRRLYDLGIFRSVQIEARPGSAPDRRDLEVRVEETAPYRIELGGGFDTRDGVRAVTALSDTNFRGRGQFLGLQLRASRSEGRVQLLLREPHLFREDLTALITSLAEWDNQVSFDSRELAIRGEIQKSFSADRRTRASLRYTLSTTDLRDVQVSGVDIDAKETTLSTFGLGLVVDRRDDLLEPRRGWYLNGDVEWAPQFIGSESEFVKVALRTSGYHSLGERLVWASGMQLGLGFPIRSDRLPLAERYFAGGGSTLRGLGSNLAGPRDPATDSPIGGAGLLVVNQELRFDLFGPFIASTFIDVGNVYEDTSSLFGDLRWSAGAGLRYRAAIVAGLDYARILDRQAGEAAGTLRFSLGYAF